MATTETTNINVAYPEAGSLHLRIGVGACQLRLRPVEGSEGEAWVTGTYEAQPGTMPVKIREQDGTVRITQEHGVGWWGAIGTPPPRFDLAVNKARPFEMTFETGASECDVDLGGLPITRLSIRQGAGKADFDFSSPNPQGMTLLDLEAGATSFEIYRLANANFSEMRVSGGAASYLFDFGGELGKDANVKVSAGMAAVTVRIPTTMAAKVYSETTLGGLDIGDGFTKEEGAFWTPAMASAAGPRLTVTANISLGSLRIRLT